MSGSSVSLTVTSNVQLALFPARSVTTNVSVVIPTGNVEPETSPTVCKVVEPEQLSNPVGGVNVMSAPQIPASFDIVISGGHEIVGSSVSFTVTVKLQVAVFDAEAVSVIVQTIVVPFGICAPAKVVKPLKLFVTDSIGAYKHSALNKKITLEIDIPEDIDKINKFLDDNVEDKKLTKDQPNKSDK